MLTCPGSDCILSAVQTLPHARAPLPASKPLEALRAGTTAGSDGMDSVMGVGIGLEVTPLSALRQDNLQA